MKTFSSNSIVFQLSVGLIIVLLFSVLFAYIAISLRPAPEPEADRAANPTVGVQPLPTVSVPSGATEEGELVPLPPILTELYIDQEGWLWTRKSRGWVRLPFLVEIPGQDAEDVSEG